MNKEIMQKTLLSIGIIILFVCTEVIPAAALQKTILDRNTENLDIFELQSNLRVSWNRNETQEPVIPRGKPRQIDLKI